eukprot:2090254-Amphidinium_carterae.1
MLKLLTQPFVAFEKVLVLNHLTCEATMGLPNDDACTGKKLKPAPVSSNIPKTWVANWPFGGGLSIDALLNSVYDVVWYRVADLGKLLLCTMTRMAQTCTIL